MLFYSVPVSFIIHLLNMELGVRRKAGGEVAGSCPFFFQNLKQTVIPPVE
jgi:hypothetical protein